GEQQGHSRTCGGDEEDGLPEGMESREMAKAKAGSPDLRVESRAPASTERGGTVSGVFDEVRPRLPRHLDDGTRHGLGGPDVHRSRTGGDLDAVPALRSAVAALEPGEAGRGRGLSGVHSSPSNLSMNSRDSRGVRACDRIIP